MSTLLATRHRFVRFSDALSAHSVTRDVFRATSSTTQQSQGASSLGLAQGEVGSVHDAADADLARTHTGACLHAWQDRNKTRRFRAAARTLWPWCQTLPLLLFHARDAAGVLLTHLRACAMEESEVAPEEVDGDNVSTNDVDSDADSKDVDSDDVDDLDVGDDEEGSDALSDIASDTDRVVVTHSAGGLGDQLVSDAAGEVGDVEDLLHTSAQSAALALPPLLDVLVALSRDLQDAFYEFFPAFHVVMVDLLELHHGNTEAVEAVFVAIAQCFKVLQRPLLKNLSSAMPVHVQLMMHSRQYIREFAAESFAFLIRRDFEHRSERAAASNRKKRRTGGPSPDTETGSCFPALLELLDRSAAQSMHPDAAERASGTFSLLLQFAVHGISGHLHSRGAEVLESALYSIVDSRTTCALEDASFHLFIDGTVDALSSLSKFIAQPGKGRSVDTASLHVLWQSVAHVLAKYTTTHERKFAGSRGISIELVVPCFSILLEKLPQNVERSVYLRLAWAAPILTLSTEGIATECVREALSLAADLCVESPFELALEHVPHLVNRVTMLVRQVYMQVDGATDGSDNAGVMLNFFTLLLKKSFAMSATNSRGRQQLAQLFLPAIASCVSGLLESRLNSSSLGANRLCDDDVFVFLSGIPSLTCDYRAHASFKFPLSERASSVVVAATADHLIAFERHGMLAETVANLSCLLQCTQCILVSESAAKTLTSALKILLDGTIANDAQLLVEERAALESLFADALVAFQHCASGLESLTGAKVDAYAVARSFPNSCSVLSAVEHVLAARANAMFHSDPDLLSPTWNSSLVKLCCNLASGNPDLRLNTLKLLSRALNSLSPSNAAVGVVLRCLDICQTCEGSRKDHINSKSVLSSLSTLGNIISEQLTRLLVAERVDNVDQGFIERLRDFALRTFACFVFGVLRTKHAALWPAANELASQICRSFGGGKKGPGAQMMWNLLSSELCTSHSSLYSSDNSGPYHAEETQPSTFRCLLWKLLSSTHTTVELGQRHVGELDSMALPFLQIQASISRETTCLTSVQERELLFAIAGFFSKLNHTFDPTRGSQTVDACWLALLCSPRADVQKAAFKCIAWRCPDWLPLYRNTLMQIIPDDTFHSSYTHLVFDATVGEQDQDDQGDSEFVTVLPDHRDRVILLVLRVLFGKLLRTKGKSQRIKGMRRTVMTMLSSFSSDELAPLILLMFRSVSGDQGYELSASTCTQSLTAMHPHDFKLMWLTSSDGSLEVDANRVVGLLKTLGQLFGVLGFKLAPFAYPVLAACSVLTQAVLGAPSMPDSKLFSALCLRTTECCRLIISAPTDIIFGADVSSCYSLIGSIVEATCARLDEAHRANTVGVLSLLIMCTGAPSHIVRHLLPAESVIQVISLLDPKHCKQLQPGTLTFVLRFCDSLCRKEVQDGLVTTESNVLTSDEIAALLTYAEAIVCGKRLHLSPAQNELMLNLLFACAPFVQNVSSADALTGALFQFIDPRAKKSSRKVARAGGVSPPPVLECLSVLLSKVSEPLRWLGPIASLLRTAPLHVRRFREALFATLDAVGKRSPETLSTPLFGLERFDTIGLVHAMNAVISNNGEKRSSSGLDELERARAGEVDFETRLAAYEWLGSATKRFGTDPSELSAIPSFDQILPVAACLCSAVLSPELALRTAAASAYANLLNFLSVFPSSKSHPAQSLRRIATDVFYPSLKGYFGRLSERQSRAESNNDTAQAHKDSLVLRAHVELLCHLCTAFPTEWPDIAQLCRDSDAESNPLLGLTHAQQHRRVRALHRLAARIVATDSPHAFRPATLKAFLLPLFEFLMVDTALARRSKHEHVQNLADACVEGIGAIAQVLPWGQYLPLLRGYLRTLTAGDSDTIKHDIKTHKGKNTVSLSIQHFEQRSKSKVSRTKEKLFMKVVCSVIEGFHADLQNQASGSSGERIRLQITNVILPPLYAHLTQRVDLSRQDRKQADEAQTYAFAVRTPVCMAIVRLILAINDDDIMDLQLPKLLTVVSRALSSKLADARVQARHTLFDIVKYLGPHHFRTVVDVMGSVLVNGFQLHILAYTTHGLLRGISDANAPVNKAFVGALDDGCVDSLFSFLIADMTGVAADRREHAGILASIPEARSTQVKCYESFQMLAEIMTFPTHVDKLIQLLARLFSSSQNAEVGPTGKGVQQGTVQTAQKVLAWQDSVKEILRRVAIGLCRNPLVDNAEMLDFVVKLVSSFGGRSNDHSSSADPQVPAIPEKKRRRGRDSRLLPALNVRYSSHQKSVLAMEWQPLFTEFAFTLLHTFMKKQRLNASHIKLDAVSGDSNVIKTRVQQVLQVLSKDSIRSRHANIVSAALKCLNVMISWPLDNKQMWLKRIVRRTFKVLDSIPASSQTAFRLLTGVMRECEETRNIDFGDGDGASESNLSVFSDDQLRHLLAMVQIRLEGELDEIHSTFALLRAVVRRKVVTPTMYDIAARVLDTSVTSNDGNVRRACSGFLVQFLVHYPMSEQRISQSLRKLMANISPSSPYKSEDGRGSVLETLRKVVDEFPTEVLSGLVSKGMLLVPVLACLAGDDSTTVRKLAGKLLGQIFAAVNESALEKSCELVATLLRAVASKEGAGLQRAAVQTVGIIMQTASGTEEKSPRRAILERFRGIYTDVLCEHVLDFPQHRVDGDSKVGWQLCYLSLCSLEDCIDGGNARQRSSVLSLNRLLLMSNAESVASVDTARALCEELVLNEHIFVRNAAIRALGRAFLQNVDTLASAQMFELSRMMCVCLASPTLSDKSGAQVCKNLLFLARSLYSVARQGSEWLAFESVAAGDDENDQIADAATEPTQANVEPQLCARAFNWLVRRLSYFLRNAGVRTAANVDPNANSRTAISYVQMLTGVRSIAGISLLLEASDLQNRRLLVPLLIPLLKMQERAVPSSLEAHHEAPAHQQAVHKAARIVTEVLPVIEEALSIIREKCGDDIFAHAAADIQNVAQRHKFERRKSDGRHRSAGDERDRDALRKRKRDKDRDRKRAAQATKISRYASADQTRWRRLRVPGMQAENKGVGD